jgi:hypothetical protein
MPVKDNFMKNKKLYMKYITAGLLFSINVRAETNGYVQDSAELARTTFAQLVTPPEQTKKETNGPMGQGTTINQGSYTGQNSQNAGSAANAAAGAALIASGTGLLPPPTTPAGIALIAMGIIALAQSGHDSNAAGQSGLTAAASDFQNKNSPASNKPFGSGNSAFNDPKVKAAAAKMAEMGYKISESGVTKPDGTFISTASLATPAGMKALGADATALKEVEKINAAVSDELSKYNSKMAVAASGGGGGAGGAHDVGPGGDEAPVAFNPFAMSADAKAKLMAGKTVNLDGEPIGVAGANIFEMVHQAYQKKRSGSQFFENEEAATLRAPASTQKK